MPEGSDHVATGLRPRAAGVGLVMLGAALAAAMWLLSQWNFLLFHGAAEIFSIVTASTIFIFAVTGRRMSTNGFLTVLGAGMAPIAVIMLLHMMSYEGLDVLVPPLVTGSINTSAQLWLISRYTLATTLLVAPFFLGRPADIWTGTTVASAASGVLVYMTLFTDTFPVAFVEGSGLTSFKIVSEYVVVAVLAAAGLLLQRSRSRTDAMVVNFTLAAIGAFIAAEFVLTLYTDAFGVMPVLGHVFSTMGFVLLLLGIVRTVVQRPMALVFSELTASEARLGRANRALAMLSEGRQAVAEAETETDLLAGICHVAVHTGGYALAWLGAGIHDERRSVRVVEVCGRDADYVDGLDVTWGDAASGAGPTGVAIRTGQPWVCRDIERDPRFEPWRVKALAHDLRSSAALPIDIGTGRWGALNLYSDESGRFDDEELALVTQLAASIGNGIESLRLRADRERLLAETRADRDQLEDAVDERTADLKAAVHDLEQANLAKDEFLRSMSHELRTPLNSIIGFSTVMLNGLAGPLNEEQETQLRMVNASGRHLLDLVSAVLDLSRIEAGAVTVQPSRFDVGGLVASAVGPLRVLAEQRGLAFSVQSPPDVAVVSDGPKVAQILVNLVSNAIKFTDTGSVTISVDPSAPEHIAIAVSDTGRGIAAADILRVREEFAQVLRDDGMKPEGTGLGLTISTRLAEMLGGRIDVVSEPDRGSTFTLVLPRTWTPSPESDTEG